MTTARFYRNWNSKAGFIVGTNLLGLNGGGWRRVVEYGVYTAACLSVVVIAFKLVKDYSSPSKPYLFI